MSIILRGIVLGVYTVLISCSSVVLSLMLYHYLIGLNYIFFIVGIFVITIVLITTYPFYTICEKIEQYRIQDASSIKDEASYGKF